MLSDLRFATRGRCSLVGFPDRGAFQRAAALSAGKDAGASLRLPVRTNCVGECGR